MLDMGFVEDIETLLDATPDTRQTVLFSRDRPGAASRTLAQQYLREPITVRIAPRGRGRGRGAAGAPDRLPGAAHAHHGRAGPGAGGRAADGGHRVLPHPPRRRRGHRDAHRARAAGRGAARRDGPGAPHPRRGSAAQRPYRAPGGHRRGRPRAGHRPAHARGQPRRAAVRRRPTCTASAGSAGPGARAWRSPWCRRRRCTPCAPVERLTGQQIEIAPVPTAADLRAARLGAPGRAARAAGGRPGRRRGRHDDRVVGRRARPGGGGRGRDPAAAGRLRRPGRRRGHPGGQRRPRQRPRPREPRGRGARAAGTRPPKAGTGGAGLRRSGSGGSATAPARIARLARPAAPARGHHRDVRAVVRMRRRRPAAAAPRPQPPPPARTRPPATRPSPRDPVLDLLAASRSRSASRVCSRRRARRSDTVGTAATSIGCPVSRSMVRSACPSRRHQGDRHALAPGPADAADAVDVGLRRCGTS